MSIDGHVSAVKFNRPAMVEVGRLDQIDRLFTEAQPPAPFPALLEEAGVKLHIAQDTPETN